MKPDGKSIYIEMLGNKISYNGKPAIMVVGIDVTARKAYQEKITHMAYHDSLTGLPNRHLYNEYLEKAMERCFQNHRLLAVMYIDLDHFKFIMIRWDMVQEMNY
ncbi:GGDEF domain-containing protein [Anaerobacillus sp. CMMVII]|nr:GGDEF domain-containing protein [Anaerobacillus sp. CMMVII]